MPPISITSTQVSVIDWNGIHRLTPAYFNTIDMQFEWRCPICEYRPIVWADGRYNEGMHWEPECPVCKYEIEIRRY